MVNKSTKTTVTVINDVELLNLTLGQLQRMALKLQEILSMMKNGEFIVAYEKLGGVLKNVLSTGGVVQRRLELEEKLQENESVKA